MQGPPGHGACLFGWLAAGGGAIVKQGRVHPLSLSPPGPGRQDLIGREQPGALCGVGDEAHGPRRAGSTRLRSSAGPKPGQYQISAECRACWLAGRPGGACVLGPSRRSGGGWRSREEGGGCSAAPVPPQPVNWPRLFHLMQKRPSMRGGHECGCEAAAGGASIGTSRKAALVHTRGSRG